MASKPYHLDDTDELDKIAYLDTSGEFINAVLVEMMPKTKDKLRKLNSHVLRWIL